MKALSATSRQALSRIVARWGLPAVIAALRESNYPQVWGQAQEVDELRSSLPGPLEALLRQERDRQVRVAVRRLPFREQRVVRLHYWHRSPFRVIGAELGVTVSLVDQVHQQALGHLRRLLLWEA